METTSNDSKDNSNRFSIKRALESEEADESLRERVETVRAALSERHGVNLRDDSYLTYLFATQASEGDFDAFLPIVVDEMYVTQRMYAETPLGGVCENVFREVADLVHAEFPTLPWSIIWDNTRTYAHTVMKIRAQKLLE